MISLNKYTHIFKLILCWYRITYFSFLRFMNTIVYRNWLYSSFSSQRIYKCVSTSLALQWNYLGIPRWLAIQEHSLRMVSFSGHEDDCFKLEKLVFSKGKQSQKVIWEKHYRNSCYWKKIVWLHQWLTNIHN